jgi:hypothetical protein
MGIMKLLIHPVERKRTGRVRVHITGIGSGMLQSTLARGIRLTHNQRLVDRQKLRGKARARAIATVNAKRLGRQPPARDKSKDYSLADDSFWATDEDEGLQAMSLTE